MPSGAVIGNPPKIGKHLEIIGVLKTTPLLVVCVKSLTMNESGEAGEHGKHEVISLQKTVGGTFREINHRTIC